MNGQKIEKADVQWKENQEIVEKAVKFIKQLKVLGYDKQTFRFEGELTPRETLLYKKRLSELIDVVEDRY